MADSRASLAAILLLLIDMRLLIDIGNTSTHAALADRLIRDHQSFPTVNWANSGMATKLNRFICHEEITAATICSVVPKATKAARKWSRAIGIKMAVFNHQNCGLGIDYPKPATIGPDRLANALAAKTGWGAPVVVVDFGTALTFDIVNTKGHYSGGIIAPGLSVMTDYLHEKTALLPRIDIRNPRTAIGKSTEEAMRIGAVYGYRGLVKTLIEELRGQLRVPKLPVVATGGHSKLLSKGIPGITKVRPLLTMEGLRLASGSSS